jgi:hypothetical protein
MELASHIEKIVSGMSNAETRERGLNAITALRNGDKTEMFEFLQSEHRRARESAAKTQAAGGHKIGLHLAVMRSLNGLRKELEEL